MRTNLHEWFMANRPEEKYFAKLAAEKQIMFVRDDLEKIASTGLTYEHRCQAAVISTHMSKSITLPVYEFHREDLGVRITLRNNFFGWKVSVESKHRVTMDSTELFDMYEKHSVVYCEGFPADRVFGSYADAFDKKPCNFTVELGGEHNVYAFMLLLMRSYYASNGKFIERS